MKRRPASLAVRLTVSIGAVITVVLLTFGWIVERSINNHFIQQDVDELNAVVQALKHTLATLPTDIARAELNQRLANAVSGATITLNIVSPRTPVRGSMLRRDPIWTGLLKSPSL